MLSVQNIVYWSPFWEGLGRERVEGGVPPGERQGTDALPSSTHHLLPPTRLISEEPFKAPAFRSAFAGKIKYLAQPLAGFYIAPSAI